MTSQGSVVVKEEAVIQADLLKKMTEKPTGEDGQPSKPTLGKNRDLISTGSTLSNSL